MSIVRIFVISFVIGLLLSCLFVCHGTQSDHDDEQQNSTTTLYVLAMVPKPNKVRPPSNDRGYSFIPAVQLAIEHINEAGFLSQRYNVKLDMLEGDSGCDVTTRTAISFTKNIYYEPEKPVIGTAGPFCSAASVRLAELTNENRSKVVNLMLGNTPTLDQHETLYQYTFGMIISSVAHVQTMIKMIQHPSNNWTRVAILYDSTRPYFVCTYQRLLKELGAIGRNDTVKYVGAVNEDFYIPLNEVRDMDIRIMFALLAPVPARKLVCIANSPEIKYTYPAFQIIFMDREASDFIGEEDFSIFVNGSSNRYTCDEEDIMKGVNGSLLLTYALDSVDNSVTTVSGYTVGEIKRDYKRKVQNLSNVLQMNDNITVEESIYAGRYYDATWALALGLNQTLSQYNHVLPFVNDSTFRTAFRDSLYDVNFQGVSVKVSFDNRTAHVSDNVDIRQVNSKTNLTSFKIGVWNGSGINYCCGNLSDLTANNCAPRNGVYIEDTFEEKPKNNHVLAGFGVFGVIVVLLITLTIHIALLILRNYKVVKASSPRLSHFIFLGCYIQIFAVLLNTVHLFKPFKDGIDGELTCNVIIFASLIGLTFIFSTIVTRSWRLYRIFNRSFNTQKYNSDWLLAVVIIILTAISMVLYIPVIVWGRVKLVEQVQVVQDSNNIPFQRLNGMCVPETVPVLFIPAIYQLLLILVAVLFAVLNRKVKLKEFNDTKRINILAFTLAILWILFGAVLIVLVSVNNEVYHVIYMFLMVLTVLVIQCILFIPLLLAVAAKRYRIIRKLNSGFGSKTFSHVVIIF